MDRGKVDALIAWLNVIGRNVFKLAELQHATELASSNHLFLLAATLKGETKVKRPLGRVAVLEWVVAVLKEGQFFDDDVKVQLLSYLDPEAAAKHDDFQLLKFAALLMSAALVHCTIISRLTSDVDLLATRHQEQVVHLHQLIDDKLAWSPDDGWPFALFTKLVDVESADEAGGDAAAVTPVARRRSSSVAVGALTAPSRKAPERRSRRNSRAADSPVKLFLDSPSTLKRSLLLKSVEVQKQRDRIAALETRADEADSRAADVERAFRYEREQLLAKMGRLSERADFVAELEHQLDESDKKVEQQARQNDVLRLERDELLGVVSRLSSRSAEHEHEERRLTLDRSELARQYESERRLRGQVDDELHQLRRTVAQLEKEAGTLRAQCSLADARVDELTAEYKQARQSWAEQKELNEDAALELAASHQIAIGRFADELHSKADELAEYKRQTELRAAEARRAAQSLLSEAKAALAESEMAASRLADEKASADAAVVQYADSLADALEKISDLEAAITKTAALLQTTERSLAEETHLHTADKNEIGKLGAEITRAHEEQAVAAGELAELKGRVVKAEQTSTDLAASLAAANDEAAALKAALSQAVEKNEALESALESALSLAAERNESAQAESKVKERLLADATQRVADLQAEAVAAASARESMAATIADLQAEAARLAEDKASTVAELRVTAARLADAERRVEQLEEALSAATSSLVDEQNASAELARQIAENEAKLEKEASRQAEINASSEREAEANARAVETLVQKVADLEAAVAQAVDENKAAECQIAQLASSLEHAEQRTSAAEQSATRLAEANARAAADEQAKNADVASLGRQLRTVEVQKSDLEEKCDELVRSLADSTERLEVMSEHAAGQQQTIAKYAQQAAENVNLLRNLSKHVEAATSTQRESAERLLSADGQLAALREESDSRVRQIGELQGRLQIAEEALRGFTNRQLANESVQTEGGGRVVEPDAHSTTSDYCPSVTSTSRTATRRPIDAPCDDEGDVLEETSMRQADSRRERVVPAEFKVPFPPPRLDLDATTTAACDAEYEYPWEARLSAIHEHNMQLPPHLRSVESVETQCFPGDYSEEDLRSSADFRVTEHNGALMLPKAKSKRRSLSESDGDKENRQKALKSPIVRAAKRIFNFKSRQPTDALSAPPAQSTGESAQSAVGERRGGGMAMHIPNTPKQKKAKKTGKRDSSKPLLPLDQHDASNL